MIVIVIVTSSSITKLRCKKNCSAFDCYFYFDCYFTEVKISLNDRAEVFSRYFLLMQTSERTNETKNPLLL